MRDLTIREWLMLAPLAVLVVLFGVFPSLILDPIDNSIQFFVERVLDQGHYFLNK